MRKNRMMRAASALLVAVLMTTCTISGTFAQYVTTASASDTARVAQWGVTVTAQTAEVFGQKYDDAINAGGTKVVSAYDEMLSDGVFDDVVAPGTNGDLGSIAITGAPEVMVDIAVTADLDLGTGWKVTGDWGPCVAVLQGKARHGQDPREAEEGAGGGVAAEQ